MKRSIKIVSDTEIELELGKVTQINSENLKMFVLEQMKDGKWRLTYSSSIIPDIKKFQSLTMVRED